MRLAFAKKKFQGDWIAFKFAGKSVSEGKVLFHEKDRHTLHRKLIAQKTSGAYITFAGPLLPKAYSVILLTR